MAINEIPVGQRFGARRPHSKEIIVKRLFVILMATGMFFGLALLAPQAKGATGYCGFPSCPINDNLYTANRTVFNNSPSYCGRQGVELDTTWEWAQAVTSTWNGYLCTNTPPMPAGTISVKVWIQCGDVNKNVIRSYASPRVYNKAGQNILWSPQVYASCWGITPTWYERAKVSSCFLIYPTGWKCYAQWIPWK